MGTKSGERMIGQLERRVEALSGEFSSKKDITSTMWVYTMMGSAFMVSDRGGQRIKIKIIFSNIFLFSSFHTVGTRHIETTSFDPASELLNFLYLVYLLYCYFTQ